MNLRIFDDSADLDVALARTIEDRLRPERTTTIALSGGSTPVALYRMLGQSPHREKLAAFPIIWVVVDERYVPESDPQSNSGMMRRTLFASGIASRHRFLSFRTDLPTAEESARDFEKEWTALGIGALDIVILGCGEDGHTASLFPGTNALTVEDRIATAVYVARLDSWRVTLTAPVIRGAQLRIVQAVGAGKAKVIRELRDGADYPVAAVTEGEDLESWWFVDRAAVNEQ